MLSVPILFMLSPSSSPSASPKPRHGGSALFPGPGSTAWAGAMWRLVQTLGLQGRFGRPQLCSGNPSSAGAGSSCSPSSTSWLAATHSLGLALPLGRVPSAETSPLGLMPVSVSHKLLKAGRSLDAGPNGGRMGARRMPWGGCPPRLQAAPARHAASPSTGWAMHLLPHGRPEGMGLIWAIGSGLVGGLWPFLKIIHRVAPSKLQLWSLHRFSPAPS